MNNLVKFSKNDNIIRRLISDLLTLTYILLSFVLLKLMFINVQEGFYVLNDHKIYLQL